MQARRICPQQYENLYLESLGISEQTLNTLVRFRWYFLWIFIGSWLSVSELEYFLSVENIEISLYAQARQSLLLLTQGNIYNRLTFLNEYLMFLEELNEPFRENWSKFLTAGYLVFWKQFPAAGYLDTSFYKLAFFSCDRHRRRKRLVKNTLWEATWSICIGISSGESKLHPSKSIK